MIKIKFDEKKLREKLVIAKRRYGTAFMGVKKFENIYMAGALDMVQTLKETNNIEDDSQEQPEKNLTPKISMGVSGEGEVNKSSKETIGKKEVLAPEPDYKPATSPDIMIPFWLKIDEENNIYIQAYKLEK